MKRIDDVDDLVMEGAAVCFKEAGEVANMCFIGHNERIVIAESNADFRTKIRFHNELQRFEHYSPNYDWIPSSYEYIKELSASDKKNAKLLAPMKKSVVINSTGFREPSEKELTVGNLVNDMFLQKTYHTKFECENSCVWLAAAMVINTENSYEAERMIEEINKYPKKYDYLDLFNKRDNPSLARKLQEINSHYRVHKVKGWDRENSLAYFMDTVKAGLYVVVLKCQGQGGERTHAVGLNMVKRRIYDCMENRDMPFTIEYLNRCCGPNREFHRFELCCELKTKFNKRKFKTEK